MEQPNQWLTQPEEDELAYMYQQDGHVPGMEQQFAEPPPLPDQHREQYYTSPMATPSSFHPPRSSNFQSFGGSSSLPNLSFGAMPAVKDEQGQPPSNFLSFGGQAMATTLNFSGGSGSWQQDGMEAVQLQAPERRSRAPGNAQEHVMAERKRREKLQQQFVSLATIVPGLKKTDKISLLGSTIEYVKQLEEKVKALEEQGTRRSADSTTVFESKCCISAGADNDAAAGTSGGGGGGDGGEYSSPAVEAGIRGNTALLKICCKERRGVLVMVLSELENQGLSIINTNVVPFTDSCLNITITAKIEEGFSSAVDLVKNLTTALRNFN
ncbi:transcription factor bHLH18 isoform X2 [Brachypodium distachyon]|uniref:BHLH domain-containing protein n=1 Tax=Brachypodium distachyon TaxID=15368 RepID=A0A0Q3JZ53_BRADI|nr:transcription factor bHLH18 isoform X2 [Brachypodium distachyon]KQK22739.1 hypothetical protein BRADI_1g69110v3 [Brachypodium distachyon]PNT77804.1 hypothetical protein BRADI_1g69110v3 [Brachypodium distachyon]|eukprot:XP_010230206.1 transcription factor bHLH18 isoform X2 [Brachypodium distachyon]